MRDQAGSNSTKKQRRDVLRTAWILVVVVLAIYGFFIGRAFIQGGL